MKGYHQCFVCLPEVSNLTCFWRIKWKCLEIKWNKRYIYTILDKKYKKEFYSVYISNHKQKFCISISKHYLPYWLFSFLFYSFKLKDIWRFNVTSCQSAICNLQLRNNRVFQIMLWLSTIILMDQEIYDYQKSVFFNIIHINLFIFAIEK